MLAVVMALYAQHAVSLWTTHVEADSQLSMVHTLARDNARLREQQQALNNPIVIQRDARALGMVRAGERPYVITNLNK